MKKVAFMVLALVLSYTSYSQQFIPSHKAKNAQVGKIKLSKLNLLHDSAPASVQGPLAKNTEIWMEEPVRKLKVGFRDEIDNPQGLKAKNSNPWDKKKEIKVDSKAVYQEPKSMRPRKTWIH
jgi:hypothetical protein